MNYPEVKDYLNSLINYEKSKTYSCRVFKLQRMRDFLKFLDNPQQSLKIIHVAGSKGKGSTCAFCAYILKYAGYRVGLYTSPHLNDFRERIRLLDPENKDGDFEGMISRRELAGLMEKIRPQARKFNRFSKFGPLTFFEVYTAAALLYFKAKNADFVVLETGLGGRLDATNAAPSLVCAITPLSLEHTDKLGSTLAKIAAEKAGIIKQKKAVVVCAPQSEQARRVIAGRCKKFQAKLIQVGRQVKYFSRKSGLDIRGLNGRYNNLKLKLIGEHQAQNAALAAGIIEALRFSGTLLAAGVMRRGLEKTRWPGRCEIVSRRPLVVLDGAQNAASAAVLKKAIRDNFGPPGKKYEKLILVLGISSDKDIAGICRQLEPLASRVILTRADTPRATPPEQIARYFKQEHYLTPSVKKAKILAQELAQDNDLILVTGSLFVVGEYRDVGR